MRMAYLETSAVNAAATRKISGADFRMRLLDLDLEPAAGQLVVHELARTAVYGKLERCRALFTLLDELAPVYHEPPDELLKREIGRFRTGGAVLPFLDHLNQVLMTNEVRNLAGGHISAELAALIKQRDADIAAHLPANNRWMLQGLERIRARNPKAIPRLGNFEAALKFFEPALERFVAIAANEPLTRSEVHELTIRLDSFPALRAHTRLWLYLNFIFLRERRAPSMDRLDDIRHVVEAAYCDVFVSADRQQTKVAPVISPGLEPLPFLTLFESS